MPIDNIQRDYPADGEVFPKPPKPAPAPAPNSTGHVLDRRSEFKPGTYPDAPPNPERQIDPDEEFHGQQPLVSDSGHF